MRIIEKPTLNLVTCPNAIVSEGSEEFTLRSAENGTQKAFHQYERVESEQVEPATCGTVLSRVSAKEWKLLIGISV